jgi:RES domain-containing protein
MKVYRIAKTKFISDLTGAGAKQYGGRWNEVDSAMLYTSANVSLCILECLVHIIKSPYKESYSLLTLEISDKSKGKKISSKSLKKDWMHDEFYTKTIGEYFLKDNELLFMEVPSCIVPHEKNILINPLHIKKTTCKILKAEEFIFDKRFFN